MISLFRSAFSRVPPKLPCKTIGFIKAGQYNKRGIFIIPTRPPVKMRVEQAKMYPFSYLTIQEISVQSLSSS